jgi:hypothetical protein
LNDPQTLHRLWEDVQLYARVQDEVVAEPTVIAAHVARAREQLSSAFHAIFDVALVQAHERLVANPGDLALRELLPSVAAALTPPDRAEATDWDALGANADEIRGFALDGLTRRLDVVGVPLASL